MSRSRSCHRAVIEYLQERLLCSAAPLGVGEVVINGETELRITGTAGNDQITVRQTPSGLVIGNGNGWTKTISDPVSSLWIHGQAGNNTITLDASVTIDATVFGGGVNDTIIAGNGNNTLYGGSGKNVLQSRGGDDTLVTLGSVADTIIGGAGFDSFWIDNKPAEKIQNLSRQEAAAGAVHRIGSYYNTGAIITGKVRASAGTRKAVGGTVIREPAVDSGVVYRSMSDHPIFADAGPGENDIFQGDVSDCYYLAVLSSTARIDPGRIRQSILDLGDSTVVVQLFKNGKPIYVREDEMLPTGIDGSPCYAGLGAQHSTWAPLMEKAFAYVRANRSSYASINSGWMDEAYAAIGGVNVKSTYTVASASALMSVISKALSAGQSVTCATTTSPPGSELVANHAYTVDRVNYDSRGNVASLTLRNPWGCNPDGTGDGYITLTPGTAFKALAGVCSASV